MLRRSRSRCSFGHAPAHIVAGCANPAKIEIRQVGGSAPEMRVSVAVCALVPVAVRSRHAQARDTGEYLSPVPVLNSTTVSSGHD
jgi:hypothetical protein